MTLSIKPLEGVGKVKFGMSSHEISEILSKTPSKFYRIIGLEPQTDAYFNSSFQIDYNNKGECVFIEISSNKNYDVLFNGINVFKTNAQDLIKITSKVEDYDHNHPELGFSYIFLKLELSLWRERDRDKYFTTIGVGNKGYFSKPNLERKKEIETAIYNMTHTRFGKVT